MQDLHSSQIGLEAELEYRRRLLATIRRAPSVEPRHRTSLRVFLAEALAHLALHLDGRSIGSVAAQHAHPAGRGNGRPA